MGFIKHSTIKFENDEKKCGLTSASYSENIYFCEKCSNVVLQSDIEEDNDVEEKICPACSGQMTLKKK